MGIEAAIAAAIVSAGASAAAAAAIASFAVSTVVSIALGALASALSPKPKTPNLAGSFSAKATGVTQNIRQPITARRILYGEARVGGALTYIETTDSDKFMHLIVVLADHEVEEIGEVWFNDTSIPVDFIDGNGDVIAGDYSGRARIKKHLGSPTQTADADIVAETPVTSDFRGRGVAYLYVTLQFDRDIYPSSVPTITAWVKGKKILDPRDATERWTANGALFSYDYITLPLDALTPGIGVSTADIDETYLNASANVCDEMVTTANLLETVNSVDDATDIFTLDADKLQYQTGDRVTVITTDTLPTGISLSTNYFVIPYQRKTNPRIKLATTLANALAGIAVDITSTGVGTHTVIKNAEPRYYGGGIVETSDDASLILDDLLSTMGGSAIYVGGQWKLKAASYHTPVFTFDETHITSPITLRSKVNRRDRFNLIKGVYVSPLNDGEPADYPAVTNSTYVTNDNGRTLPIDYDLPMTQRPHTAQRMAKIKLERHRQELFFEASYSLHAMQVQPGDVVLINNDRFGWVSKPFEVIKWSLTNTAANGQPPLFSVKMSLQETASAVYDWNSGEETAVDPAPDTNLPNPLRVFAPTGFSLDSLPIETKDGDVVYNVKASWVVSPNPFVASGGKYEVKFKETTQVTYSSAGTVDGDVTEMILPALRPDPILYDVQLYAYNNLGVRSAATTLSDFKLGDTIVTDAQDWENDTLVAEDYENDTLVAEDWN